MKLVGSLREKHGIAIKRSMSAEFYKNGEYASHEGDEHQDKQRGFGACLSVINDGVTHSMMHPVEWFVFRNAIAYVRVQVECHYFPSRPPS